MSEYNEGDLIEATKDETVIRGRLCGLFGEWLGGSLRTVNGLTKDGYALTLIEKATSPLPTAEGVYRSRTGALWTIEPPAPLKWVGDNPQFSLNNPHNYAPFTRLEPVADTAKKVLDRVLEAYQNEHPRLFISDVLPLVSKEFGVTS